MAQVNELEKKYLTADLLIIGGGVAACFGAVRAAERGLSVVLMSRSMVGRGGCSRIASNIQGPVPNATLTIAERKGLPKAVFKNSRPIPGQELTDFQKGMMSQRIGIGGFWLADQDYPFDVAEWTFNQFFNWFEERGMYIRRLADGSLIRNFGPFQMAVWFPRQGQSGPQVMNLLKHEIAKHKNIRTIEECTATTLLKKDDEVIGAVGLDETFGTLYVVSAKATILATGQTAKVTTRTTAAREDMGIGHVIAYDAGAETKDLELFYIHVVDNKDPLTYNQHAYPNPNPATDKTPHLFNSYGEFYFTPDMYRQGTTFLYHLQYKHTVMQIMQGKAKWDGGYYSGYKHMKGEFTREYSRQRKVFDHLGYMNLEEELIENAMNFEANFNGGIYSNLKTEETCVRGLYAAGGIAGRTNFNACSFSAENAVISAAKRVKEVQIKHPDPEQVKQEEARLLGFLKTSPNGGYRPGVILTKIREIMTETLFPWKNEQKMKTALEEFRKIRNEMVPNMALESTTLRHNQGWINAIDVDFALRFCELYLHSALERKESRGPFCRDDYLYTDNENYLVNIIMKKGPDGEPTVRKVPVNLKYAGPKERTKVDYFKQPY